MVFFSNKKTTRDHGEDEQKYVHARTAYFNGQIKVVTTDSIAGRDVKFVFGLVVSRTFNADNAFFGMVSSALEAGADAILGYNESVSFHPEGDRHYSCYGTAVLLEPLNKRG